MKIEQLEKRVDQLRGKPLMLLCMTPGGQEKRMTITECIATNSLFLRVLPVICVCVNNAMVQYRRVCKTFVKHPQNICASPFSPITTSID